MSDEENDFQFDFADPEFIEVYKLFCAWIKKKSEGKQVKQREGEDLAAKFEHYVKTKHEALALKVKRDSGIYEAVVGAWTDDIMGFCEEDAGAVEEKK